MFTRITLKTAAAAAVALLLVGGTALASDPIKERKDGFEHNKDAMKEIKGLLDKGDVAAVGPIAQKMAAFGAQIPALFPEGSDKGKTKAKPEIWMDFAAFTAKAKAFETAAKGLETAAATGDKAATMKQFAAVGGSCKACHESFRED